LGNTTHKADVENVVLGCRTEDEVKNAYIRIRENMQHAGNSSRGAIIEKMIQGGIEVMVGVTQHPTFGTLIMFGTGGIYAELFKDVIFNLHPLTDIDAREMIKSVRAYQLLEGKGGTPKADISSIEELLLRISLLVENHPQILEMDLNPVKVMPEGEGYIVVDSRIMVSAESPGIS